MADALRVTVDVIVHATEDVSKLFDAFEENLGVRREEFSERGSTGHYDNPITVISADLRKGRARDFLDRALGMLSASQRDEMVGEIAERTERSKFHVRLGKQEFLGGRLAFEENDAIRLRIHAPVYNRRDTVATFSGILSGDC